MLIGYRARPQAVTRLAAHLGITPSTEGIAAATGLSERTISRIRSGERVSRRTAEALTAELGGTLDLLFRAEPVERERVA
jgi:transcriptional regulator with XRE-family HTH domain